MKKLALHTYLSLANLFIPEKSKYRFKAKDSSSVVI